MAKTPYWAGQLRKFDWEMLKIVFGFESVEELRKFVAEQETKEGK